MTAKAKSPSMAQLAAEMRAIVDGPGAAWVHRRLSRGLEMVLQRNDRQYRLAIARPDDWPSLSEIIVCRQAFAVPHGTEPARLKKERPSKIANTRVQTIPYYVVELLWREEPKP